MDIKLFEDLIKDDRGNYYTAVHLEGNELTLVNALAERAYVDLLEFSEDFKKEFAAYEHQFVGKIALDRLRHDVVFALSGHGEGSMHDLEDVLRVYRAVFIDVIEFYRNPRSGRR